MIKKLTLSQFSVSLFLATVILSLLIWSGALYRVVEDSNQLLLQQTKQLRQSQVEYLQQKQRLWLQSQYYLMNRLLKSEDQSKYLQSFLWDYYQRNPSIWSVALIEPETLDEPASKPTKTGCFVLNKSNLEALVDALVPVVSSCRIADKALLEIVGPVADRNTFLVVSMDYFSFVTELSELTQDKVRLIDSADELIQYSKSPDSASLEGSFEITLNPDNQTLGVIQLDWQPMAYVDIWQGQLLPITLALLLLTGIVHLLFYKGLIRPVVDLASRMFQLSASQKGVDSQFYPLKPGLSALYEYFDTLQNRVKCDALTGLNNRTIFMDRLDQAITEAKRSGRKHALILIDVVNLDDIRHRQGQHIADGLIKKFSERLVSELRESDNVSRFDKNTFAILLEVNEVRNFFSFVETLYLSLIPPLNIHGRDLDIILNIGISIYPEHGANSTDLYHNASLCLIEAGHSDWPIVFYQGEGGNTDSNALNMIQSLRQSIDEDEFKLVFQPVVDLSNYHTVYVEALLRWKQNINHTISIEKTIELAEKNNLIKPLTNWVFRAVCGYLAAAKIDGLVVGINLSMIDLHDKKLPERIEEYLQYYLINPEQIVIEITEGQIMAKPDEVLETLTRLATMGLSLSIDDFGTGQASLAYLKKLPVQNLKIDRSFVTNIETDSDDELIVKATIELAHTLGIKVIAEGVETAASYELLQKMGCDFVQGYYISRPMEAEQLKDWYSGVRD